MVQRVKVFRQVKDDCPCVSLFDILLYPSYGILCPPARTVAKASMVIPSTPGALPCDYWALSCPGIWLVTFLCRFSYFNVLRNYKTLNKCRRYFFAPSLVGGKGFSVDVYSSGITSPRNKASPFRTKISFPISVFQTS